MCVVNRTEPKPFPPVPSRPGPYEDARRLRPAAPGDDEGPPAAGCVAAPADGGAAAGPGAGLLPRRALHPVVILRRPGYAPPLPSLPRSEP